MTFTDEKPPFWGSWARIYAGIIAYLALLVLLFDWFTRSWNR